MEEIEMAMFRVFIYILGWISFILIVIPLIALGIREILVRLGLIDRCM